MDTPTNKKSGKGLSHGVVSELAAFFEVVPGHEKAIREACQRFAKVVMATDPLKFQKAGMRDVRFVMFDNDTRIQMLTTLETDWVPYIDDAVMVIGPEHWRDWQQHCVGFDQYKSQPDLSILRDSLQAHQIPAAAYFNQLADYTIPQIKCDLATTARGAIAGHGGRLKLIFRADNRKLLGIHCIGDIASELVGLGHLALHVGSTVEIFLTLALNTPTYSAAYHDAAADGLARLAEGMGYKPRTGHR